MKVFKNLFGNESKIHASEIVMGTKGNYKTLDEFPSLKTYRADLSAENTNQVQVFRDNWHTIGNGAFIFWVVGGNYGTHSTFWGQKTTALYGSAIEISYGMTNPTYHRISNGVWSQLKL